MQEKNPGTKYTAGDLNAIIARLRDPETGCPWDRSEEHTSELQSQR